MIPDTYFGLESPHCDLENSRAVILPVPYEQTTSYARGCGKGPEALKTASQQVELYDEVEKTEPFKAGIFSAPPVPCDGVSPEAICDRVKEAVLSYARRGKFVATLGGEHTASVGSVWAYRELHPDVHVLQIDAHADLRPQYEGSPFSHACAAARMCENKHPLTQVGIRNFCIDEVPFVSKKKPTWTFLVEETRKDPKWIPKVVKTLGKNVYITIDLDGLDPSVVPGVGTPEPGGLGWYETMDLLRKVCRERNVVGLDIVELMPIPGQVVSEYAAAKLLYRLLGYCFDGGKAAPRRKKTVKGKRPAQKKRKRV